MNISPPDKPRAGFLMQSAVSNPIGGADIPVCRGSISQGRQECLPQRRDLPPRAGALYAAILLVGVWALPALAVDQVTLRRAGKTTQLEGRVLVTARDGGVLFLGRDGVLWTIPPDELAKHTHDDRPFEPLSREELIKRILPELPAGFKAHQTTHYLIFHDTSPAYAQWCGALFERLYLAFRNFWTRKGFELAQPEFPLVAIVFADRESYLKFSRPELGEAGESIIGYFSRMSNRMTMYDLTGLESQGRGAPKGRTTAQINQILAQPDALRTVATIVHEATHQIAFNCGLHARLSDCPLWFCEGIAMYFETPDLSSAKGWKGIGAVNRPRVERFGQYLASRPANSLETSSATTSGSATCSRPWTPTPKPGRLTYFLMKQRPRTMSRTWPCCRRRSRWWTTRRTSGSTSSASVSAISVRWTPSSSASWATCGSPRGVPVSNTKPRPAVAPFGAEFNRHRHDRQLRLCVFVAALSALGRGPLDQLPRHANVEDVQAAEIRSGLGGEKAGLGGDERAGLGGADGVRGRSAGFAIQPAGQVHRQLRRGGGIEPGNHRIQRRARLAAAAGPQQRIDDPSGPVEPPREPRFVEGTAEHLDRHVGLGQDMEIGRGVAGQLFGLCPKQHANRVAAEVEMPGNHESVARVVPSPAADHDRPGDAKPTEHVGHAPAGVLHQHEPRKAKLLDGQPIDQAGLFAGERCCRRR